MAPSPSPAAAGTSPPTGDSRLIPLFSLYARRVSLLEQALAIVVRHAATDALARDLNELAQAHADDAASSMVFRLARIARQS